ncbi:sulfite exporter TauE/SafE family protein [Pelomicrobium methylotrophicum]|uniref:Probable membrane transporter protein n=1 Tax=Pelomicrobium methylotrophicum TaxID=2602750 RepID=A0A5C7EST5_9PROT|nr:sulfite exporter TauE/SafE family protein [Pelomicrobium methylotrophicum]TXF10907.1 sulfite exporter TauE/SafE family protein [Pelomicrobium methylotrophicum]
MDGVTSLAGFLVGVLVGLTGIGGGALMTPLLILGLGVAPAAAVGTDLLYASITKVSATWWNHRERVVDWRTVGLLALGSLPASLAALMWLGQVGTPEGLDRVIRYVMAVALILTGVALLFGRRAQALVVRARLVERLGGEAKVTIAMGAAMGVLVTVSSVGAGALGVAFLSMVYPAWPARRIVASDIAHAVPLTLVAGLGHAALGTVQWGLLASLLIGSVPGVWVGTRLGKVIPETALRRVMGMALVAVAGKLIG